MGADCKFQHEKAARRTNRDSWYFWRYFCLLERASLVAPPVKQTAFDPWVGRSPGGGNGKLPENPRDRGRSLLQSMGHREPGLH